MLIINSFECNQSFSEHCLDKSKKNCEKNCEKIVKKFNFYIAIDYIFILFLIYLFHIIFIKMMKIL